VSPRGSRKAARSARPAPIAIAWVTRCRRPLEDRAVRRIARAALAFGKRPGVGLSLVFVDDAALAALHGQWLDDASPTDVISFDLDGAGNGPVGELYISVERAAALAARRKLRVQRELALYIVHGCLHLCGFDDARASARSKMRRAECEVLASLGFEDDPTPFE
jgi:probable rRNA maturation factor